MVKKCLPGPIVEFLKRLKKFFYLRPENNLGSELEVIKLEIRRLEGLIYLQNTIGDRVCDRCRAKKDTT